MKDQERWKELCEQAAKEHDRNKLMELTKEIIRLLDEKDARLKQLHHPTDQKPIGLDARPGGPNPVLLKKGRRTADQFHTSDHCCPN
jgi:hypothetical protein